MPIEIRFKDDLPISFEARYLDTICHSCDGTFNREELVDVAADLPDVGVKIEFRLCPACAEKLSNGEPIDIQTGVL